MVTPLCEHVQRHIRVLIIHQIAVTLGQHGGLLLFTCGMNVNPLLAGDLTVKLPPLTKQTTLCPCQHWMLLAVWAQTCVRLQRVFLLSSRDFNQWLVFQSMVVKRMTSCHCWCLNHVCQSAVIISLVGCHMLVTEAYNKACVPACHCIHVEGEHNDQHSGQWGIWMLVMQYYRPKHSRQ